MQEKFDSIDLDIAKKIVASDQGDDYTANAAFCDGDHWQKGSGWVGPSLPTSDAKYTTYMSAVERGFVFQNVTKEIVGRHIGGVLGITPKVSAIEEAQTSNQSSQANANQSLIEEAQAIWDVWWGNHATDDNFLNEAARIVLLGNHAVIRGLLPPALIQDGQAPKMVPDEAAKSIQIAVHSEECANIWRYPASAKDVAVYTYKRGDGIFEPFGEAAAELSYLAEDGTTILRTTDADSAVALPLGGILTMHKIERETLIGAAARSLQRSLNMALTMWRRNMELAGFRERTYLNAEFPTIEVDDGAGGRKNIPAPMTVGAGAANFLRGMTYQDIDGSSKVATPSMIYGDPVPVESFVQSVDKFYALILAECHQLHAVLSANSSVSGESRIQAQAEFEADLNLTADALTSALEWAFQFVLSMTAYLSGAPGRYAGIKAQVTVTVQPTPMSTDERRFWLDAANDRKISDRSLRTRLGIDDDKAEVTQIEEEDAAATKRQQGEIAGFDAQAAGVLAQLRQKAGANGVQGQTN